MDAFMTFVQEMRRDYSTAPETTHLKDNACSEITHSLCRRKALGLKAYIHTGCLENTITYPVSSFQ